MDSSMSRFVLTLLLLAGTCVQAADLKLELPKQQWVLQQSELPLQQREGQVLPIENEFVQKVLPLLNTNKPDQVLQLIKTRYGEVTTLLEAGDSEGVVKGRIVTGGVFTTTRPNGISATMMYLIGNAYLGVKNYKTAELAFRLALGVLPEYIRVYESLGVLMLVQERYKDAFMYLSRAAQLGLNTPNLYGALGYLNQKLNNSFGAVSAYQNAMMLEPDNQQWQQGLLFSLAASKQQSAGLALVDQLLAADPDKSDLWVYRSALLLQADKKQQGLDSLEVAIRLGDDSLANLQVCASLHMELGSVERAVALLKSGMDKGLDFSFIDQSLQWLAVHEQWASMQKLLEDTGKNRTGLNDVQQSHLLMHRASVSVHNNEVTLAKSQLQQATTLDPANAEALFALGRLYRQDKSYAQAELVLQRASASAGFRENAQLLLSQVAIDQHNYTRALQLMREVYAGNPARTDLARNINTLEELVQLQGSN